MAVNTKTPAAPKAAPLPEDQAVERATEPEPQQFKLELAKLGRYMYGRLYLKDEQYVFGETDARHMLALRDPQSLPVFRIARPRMRMVAVEDNSGVVVASARPARAPERQVMALQDFKFGQTAPPVPVGKIELGDDDVESAERLAAIDAQGAEEAGLLDSAQTL